MFITDNPLSARALSVIGALATIGVSIVNIVLASEILSTFLLGYLINYFQVIMGLIILIVDGRENWVPSWREMLFKYAFFLNVNMGRAFFYIFSACVVGCYGHFYNSIVGWYLNFVGFWHLALKFQE